MYVKLFSSLYQGTLRGRPDEILVFTNLLAQADQYGIVDKHWKAISEETGISRERVEAAITNLESPDEDSRSPEEHGRRIIRMDEHRAWGWKIVNYGKYRAIKNEDDRREQNRLAQERWRNKRVSKVSKVSKVSRDKPPSAQAEADTDTEESKDRAPKRATALPRPFALSEDWLSEARRVGGAVSAETEFAKFCDHWWGNGKSKMDWLATWRNWIRRAAEFSGNGHAKDDATTAWVIVRQAIKNGKPQAITDPRTLAAIERMGGWSGLAEMRTDQAPFRQREFEAAYGVGA